MTRETAILLVQIHSNAITPQDPLKESIRALSKKDSVVLEVNTVDLAGISVKVFADQAEVLMDAISELQGVAAVSLLRIPLG